MTHRVKRIITAVRSFFLWSSLVGLELTVVNTIKDNFEPVSLPDQTFPEHA